MQDAYPMSTHLVIQHRKRNREAVMRQSIEENKDENTMQEQTSSFHKISIHLTLV